MKIRLQRFLICTLAPPFLGAAPYVIFFLGTDLEGILTLFAYSYGFALLPSLIYFGVMEIWFSKQKNTSYLTTGVLSSLVGSLAGTAIAFIFNAGAIIFFAFKGLVVGIVLGAILEGITARDREKRLSHDRPDDL